MLLKKLQLEFELSSSLSLRVIVVFGLLATPAACILTYMLWLLENIYKKCNFQFL